MTGEEVADLLGLTPLPEEGGLFAETFRDAHATAIYYLLIPPDFSALHRLTTAEVVHHYAGAPTQMLLLAEDGTVQEPVLGPDLDAGERPQLTVPAGAWQGNQSLGEWSLLGATVAPPFEPSMFEAGVTDQLVAGWPQAAERIAALTRR